eukprot:SAG31_NODE_43175_length_268_cov_0.615385_1_plen_54_part_10
MSKAAAGGAARTRDALVDSRPKGATVILPFAKAAAAEEFTGEAGSERGSAPTRN